jgi:hypothetical protein
MKLRGALGQAGQEVKPFRASFQRGEISLPSFSASRRSLAVIIPHQQSRKARRMPGQQKANLSIIQYF